MSESIRRPFTVDEYERIGAAGILTIEDRVELIAGEIVEKPVIGPRHAECVARCTRTFVLRFNGRAVVRPQNPVRLEHTLSEPEPDIVLVHPRAGGFGDRHPEPGEVLLVVEVADTSLRADRMRKVPLYAAEGIADMWIIDIEAQRVEIYREPRGDGYASVTFAESGATITMLAFPDEALAVNDMLP